jgi:flagellar P-ring protein precursor FlgI
MAQGALAIGGFRYEQNGTVRQKNHPTAGSIPEGAIAQRAVTPELLTHDGSLDLILNDPDFTTATRVASAINAQVRNASAAPIAAGRVRLSPSTSEPAGVVALIASIENLPVEPDGRARVVVNERTGTIVSGGNVTLSEVTVTQGDIRVAIDQRFIVSQPDGVLYRPSRGIRTAVVPETTIDATESGTVAVDLPRGATISDLVSALKGIHASSRDVIAILQGIKRAGALHAELVIQ